MKNAEDIYEVGIDGILNEVRQRSKYKLSGAWKYAGAATFGKFSQ